MYIFKQIEILGFMLKTFKTENIPDTDENKLAFLTDLRDIWLADEVPELLRKKNKYVKALNTLIHKYENITRRPWLV